MKATEASGITKEKNSKETVTSTEVKTESKKNARKTTPKTSKKSTVKSIEKIVEKPVMKAEEKPATMIFDPIVNEVTEVNLQQKQTKETVKKSSAKKIKKEFYFECFGQQIDEASLMKKVVTDCSRQSVTVKEIKLYLKPEDNACYYVANGNVAGKVELY